MASDEIMKRAFKLACQYLQYNAPCTFATFEPDELRACAGSASYDAGWKQWARYFISKVESNTDSDLVNILKKEFGP